MRIAIMQPYFFPYIGYFQLVKAVDKFIFYDDVAYIKQGWINRNRILINSSEHLITLKLRGASSYKLINEIESIIDYEKIIKTIAQAYFKAPFFNEVMPLIQKIFSCINESNNIGEVAKNTVIKVSEYLDISTVFETSSEFYSATRYLKKEERLIAICKVNQAETYINSSGGRYLYNKSKFREEGIELSFIKNHIPVYPQFKNDFIPGLSIIDILMFNSPDLVNEMISQYELE